MAAAIDLEKLVKRAKDEAESEAETFVMYSPGEEATPRDARIAYVNSRVSQVSGLNREQGDQVQGAYEQAFIAAVKASL